MMNKVPIWWTPGNWMMEPQLRLNQGEAKDLGGGEVEYELAYEGDLDTYWGRHFSAYRVFADGFNTPWCFTEEEAHRMADELGVPSNTESRRLVMIADIERPHLKPLEFPVNKFIYRGDKGLFCRLNLHPEIDGSYQVSGKFFFPDWECADDICEGPCIITEVDEKGSYGFFKGHMQQFKAPSDSLLDEYIQKHEYMYDQTLRYMNGKFGEYIAIFTIRPFGQVEYRGVLVQNDAGMIEDLGLSFAKYDDTAVVARQISVIDYLCEGYHDCKFDDLVNKFIKPAFEPYQSITSSKYISKLFDDAVADGFLQPMMFQNVLYIRLESSALIHSLMGYSREEMAELITKVNEINQKANAAIKAKIRNGKAKAILRP